MRIQKDSWILNKPIAHRGLWGNGVPENSMLAYQKATEKNYPIEIDIYLTKDDKIVSFHDSTLKRMTGADGNIWDYTYDELKKLKLNGSEYTIPLLEDILALCKGKSPLLIEIKNQPNNSIVDKAVEILKSYDGEFAVQSFNPLYIKRVKKIAPNFIRGILATPNAKQKSKFKNYVIKNMPLNFIIKPDFISCEHNYYPLSKKKTKGKVLLAWTLTNKNAWDKVKPFVDNIIFENFTLD